ncbi:Gal83p [Saccharomyces eubayanus]|uniref:Gal83p n=1 Tax=Saccharomyces eubayanus TaxID=1080349 RepID=UPI0006C0BAA5|nr:GAL83-like protein [Saccharomyces eubayanus]KOG99974.1 GAL83-like protein [Saccharomyces eubayanus]
MAGDNSENKDASMLDVSDAASNSNKNDGSNSSANQNNEAALAYTFSQMNVDNPNELEPQPPLRHKSSLIFNDDDDDEIPPYSNHAENGFGETFDSDDDNIGGSSSSSIDSNEADGHDADMTANTLQNTDYQSTQQADVSQNQSPQQQQDEQQGSVANKKIRAMMLPIDITWQQGGSKVYVTGSFTGWRKMIGLVPVPGQPGIMHVKLQLPPGTHRFRFIVDNELRFSDYLPTATDQMGNFVNYMEVTAPPDWSSEPQQQASDNKTNHADDSQSAKRPMSARSRIALEIEKEPDDMGDGYTRFHDETPSKPDLEYTQDIPAVFTDPNVMEQYYLTLDQQQNNHQNMAWLTPPQLPPHLENVILNNYSNAQTDNNENTSGALPIPNHVILNHLATSSIKHNTLCVASIVRYKQKYVTQILYTPLQ